MKTVAGHSPVVDLGYEARTGGSLATDDAIRRARRWMLGVGGLALVAGVVAVAVPAIASVAMAIFIGWILVAAGGTIAIHAFERRAGVRALEALVTFAAGAYLLLFPLSGTVSLTFVLAVWLFVSGIISLILAARWSSGPSSWINAFGAALSVLLGFLIAFNLPSSASWAIGLMVGINLIFWGVRALVGAHLLKELAGPGAPRSG
jgi:uncharacterized membrane protein HdeD (DUF308 family)